MPKRELRQFDDCLNPLQGVATDSMVVAVPLIPFSSTLRPTTPVVHEYATFNSTPVPSVECC